MAKYIKKKDLKNAIDECTWYHIGKNGELVEGANSAEHEPLYKYSDIKEIIKNLPTRKFETEPKRTALSKALKWTYGDEPNCSEKPNNCEDLQDWKDRMWAEAIVTEPTISKMEQVDKDINVRSKDEPTTQTETQNSNLTFKTLEYCDICDHKGCEECIANALDEHCMPSQFNKQIEDECAKEYEELGLKELKELIKADRKDESQTMLNDGTLVINVEDATKVSRVLVGDDKNRGDLYYPDDEDEPQKERSE